MKGDY